MCRRRVICGRLCLPDEREGQVSDDLDMGLWVDTGRVAKKGKSEVHSGARDRWWG